MNRNKIDEIESIFKTLKLVWLSLKWPLVDQEGKRGCKYKYKSFF